MHTRWAWAVAALAILTAQQNEIQAQQPERADSLARELRALQQRLDSLQGVVARLVRQGQDTSGRGDELARLRAAAQRAAQPPAEPTPRAQAGARDLSALNPEISVTGDIVGGYLAPAGEAGRATAVPREFEFSIQSALDPYTRTKIFLTHERELEIAGIPEDTTAEEHGGGLELEEGYLYWVGLPGGLGLKAGHFRQEIGLYNRWHTHALFELDRPLAATTFLGDDGLIQTGAAVSLPAFTFGPATQMVLAEATVGSNDALFDGGTQFSYLGRVQSYWDIGGGTTFQLGGTGVWGENGDVDLTTTLWAVDVLFRWTPPGRSLYRDLQLKGEWYFAKRNEAGTVTRGNGGYGQANLRLSRQWIAGARVDYVEPYGGAPSITQVAPSLTWWQSEWVRVRGQYNLVRITGGESHHTLSLQIVWAVGPHKHETY